MRDPENLTAEVFLDGRVPADRERGLVDALAALGVRAQAKVVPARRGLGEVHWLVLVAVPLQAFLSSVGSKVAEDAYQGLKRAISRLLGRDQEQPAAEQPRPRPLVLQDTASGLQVVLEVDLPDTAYQQLVGLDPEHLSIDPWEAATKEGAAKAGRKVAAMELPSVDLVVCGSVAVNRQGARVGKGGGFSDLEVAFLVEAGVIRPDTILATTVHPLQVMQKPLPETIHDFRVDLIVTPNEAIRCAKPHRPPGILWEHLDQDKIAEVPALAALAARR